VSSRFSAQMEARLPPSTSSPETMTARRWRRPAGGSDHHRSGPRRRHDDEASGTQRFVLTACAETSRQLPR